MPLYDFECQCGNVFESIVPSSVTESECDRCGMPARRIISASGQFCANQDAPWIRTVLEVVDKDSKKPHCVEFIKNPTRDNYKKWMKGEGLRPVDYSVRGAPPVREVPQTDTTRARQEAWEKFRQRRRIEVQ